MGNTIFKVLNEETNEELEVEVVLQFKIKEFDKEYIVFTRNERDGAGNILLYSATLMNNNGVRKTTKIETEEEWNIIKELIRKIAKGEYEDNENK